MREDGAERNMKRYMPIYKMKLKTTDSHSLKSSVVHGAGKRILFVAFCIWLRVFA